MILISVELSQKYNLKLQQALQASAGEYFIQILPDRFQVLVASASPDTDHIATLKDIAYSFIDLYTSKRSILAVGHNFAGTFVSPMGSAADYMKHLAWRGDFASALQLASEPTLSLITSASISEDETLTVRLEPRTTDKSRVFYDLNFNWGGADKPLQTPVHEVIDRFADSLKFGEDLIDRLAKLGGTNEGDNE